MDYIKSLNRSEILIVDIVTEHIKILTSILKKGNYIVSSITDEGQLFKALKKSSPDLIFLSSIKPGNNGLEICGRLKQDINYNTIPVIFLADIDDVESIVKGFQMGAQQYILKSEIPDVMLAKIENCIKIKRQMDKIEEEKKEIESFSCMVAHDLKAPLLDIQKLAIYMKKVMASYDLNEEKQLLRFMGEKADEAVILMEKYSQLAKISYIPLKVEAVDMNNLMKEVYEKLLVDYPNRKIEFNCPCLPIVYGDKMLLRQVLVNILLNAIKFTECRNLTEISVSFQEKEREYVFSVRDNGVGFDMKYSGKLFGMFQRLHSLQEFEGTGTGLAIVKKILDRHDGRVWIEAEPNKGALLSFTIPLRVN